MVVELQAGKLPHLGESLMSAWSPYSAQSPGYKCFCRPQLYMSTATHRINFSTNPAMSPSNDIFIIWFSCQALKGMAVELQRKLPSQVQDGVSTFEVQHHWMFLVGFSTFLQVPNTTDTGWWPTWPTIPKPQYLTKFYQESTFLQNGQHCHNIKLKI